MAHIYWLSREDPAWDAAWSVFPDKDIYNEAYGESLQYMGTVAVPGDGRTTVGSYAHQFRNRAMQRHLERLGA